MLESESRTQQHHVACIDRFVLLGLCAGGGERASGGRGGVGGGRRAARELSAAAAVAAFGAAVARLAAGAAPAGAQRERAPLDQMQRVQTAPDRRPPVCSHASRLNAAVLRVMT